jgi:hypothetical protein
VTSLKQGFILLEEDEPNTIVWSKNKKYGNYTIKLGYLAIAEEQVEGVSNGGGNQCGNGRLLKK